MMMDDDDLPADLFTDLDMPACENAVRLRDISSTAAEEAEPATAKEEPAAEEDDAEPAEPPPPAAKKSRKDDDAKLPFWMRSTNAITIAPRTPPVDSLGLDARLLRALTRMGVQSCFPVQAAIVPVVLAGLAAGYYSDICVSAPTGSGKTLAYALPVIENLINRIVPRLRALVLVPTRGLALQVHRVFEALVATPGRLVEHLSAHGGLTLEHLTWLVVDEADRLLQHGYQGWLPHVLAAAHQQTSRTPGAAEPLGTRCERAPLGSVQAAMRGLPLALPPQPPLTKMLFSATLTRDPSKLAPVKLQSPRFFTVEGSRYTSPTR